MQTNRHYNNLIICVVNHAIITASEWYSLREAIVFLSHTNLHV